MMGNGRTLTVGEFGKHPITIGSGAAGGVLALLIILWQAGVFQITAGKATAATVPQAAMQAHDEDGRAHPTLARKAEIESLAAQDRQTRDEVVALKVQQREMNGRLGTVETEVQLIRSEGRFRHERTMERLDDLNDELRRTRRGR